MVQRTAEGVTPSFQLPRAWLRGTLDFSFSGLKTALLHKAQELGVYPAPEEGPDQEVVAELAAAFQESVVDVISAKAAEAARLYDAKGLVLGGGVSANGPLRQACRDRVDVPVLIPAPRLCTDNGSMIAAAGYYRHSRGVAHGLDLDVAPSLALA